MSKYKWKEQKDMMVCAKGIIYINNNNNDNIGKISRLRA